MISLTTPDRVKGGDVALSTILLVAVLLFAPDSLFKQMNVDWLLGLFILPLMFSAGLFSNWLYYRDHSLSDIDPFFIRAWWSLISGLIALPLCLLFRPSVAHLAFIVFTFGFAPVLAFYTFRRNK